MIGHPDGVCIFPLDGSRARCYCLVMMNETLTAAAAAESTTPHSFALRRAWQCGYDAAARCSELLSWVRDDARLATFAEEYDADLEHPAGWAAWLAGFGIGCCEDRVQALAVQSAGQGKVDELDE